MFVWPIVWRVCVHQLNAMSPTAPFSTSFLCRRSQPAQQEAQAQAQGVCRGHCRSARLRRGRTERKERPCRRRCRGRERYAPQRPFRMCPSAPIYLNPPPPGTIEVGQLCELFIAAAGSPCPSKCSPGLRRAADPQWQSQARLRARDGPPNAATTVAVRGWGEGGVRREPPHLTPTPVVHGSSEEALH